MAPLRSIAVAQTCPIPGDVEANIREHITLARVAAGAMARIVVYPELSLTGYELPLAEGLAFSENDSRLDSLRDPAQSLSVTLIVGAPVRLDSSLHIGALILSPSRTVEIYTKQRLGTFPPSAKCDSLHGEIPPSERAVFQAGNLNPLVRVGGQTAALAVCADTGSPAHASAAAERGADSYLAGMFVIPSDYDADAGRLREYARQHHMLTALANFGGPSGGLRSAGRSSIWSESGELLVQLDPAGSGVAVVVESPDGWSTQSIMVSDKCTLSGQQ